MCPLCYSDLCKCKIAGALEDLFLEGSDSIDTTEDAGNGNTESPGAGNSSEDDEYFPWDVRNDSDIYY